MDWKSHLWPEWSIEEKIGEGAYGKVYKIKRTDIGGTYYSALKVISFPNEYERKRFYSKTEVERQHLTQQYHQCIKDLSQEIALLEKLKGHTNIVTYEDHKIIAHADGFSYDILIRMELLESLSKYLLTHISDERLAIKVGTDICEALILCENEGILHCDIKPGNIFVSSHGEFKLGDFSIAHIVEKIEGDQKALGTYYYIAPEVAAGRGLNKTIDLYSLGLVLYRILNGGLGPFLPTEPEKITHSLMEEANRKRLQGQEINRPLYASFLMARVVMKACQYNPERRYDNAKKMKKAIELCRILSVNHGKNTDDSTKEEPNQAVLMNNENKQVEEPFHNIEKKETDKMEKKKTMRDFFSPADDL